MRCEIMCGSGHTISLTASWLQRSEIGGRLPCAHTTLLMSSNDGAGGHHVLIWNGT